MADAAATALSLQDRGPTVLTVTIVMLCLSTVFIALRLVSRIGIVKRVSMDDYAIMLAWLIAFGFSFSICYGTRVGLGRHEVDVSTDDRASLRKAEYGFSVLYNPALMATKTSICLFYLTLSKNQRVFRWTTIWTLVVVNVAGLALTFLNFFQCRPPGAAFNDPPGSMDNAHCIDIVTLYLSSAPVNIITDVALLFLPMPILTSMKLPRNEKIILVATFSFGAFVAGVDVVRISYLESAALARLQSQGISSVATEQQGDYSWIASLSFMWSAVEVHVGIICACVPGVKPLAAKVFPSLLGTIKKAGDLAGNPFYGPGDAQWANVVPSQQSGPRSPLGGSSGGSALQPPRRPLDQTSRHSTGRPQPLDPPRSPLDGNFRHSAVSPQSPTSPPRSPLDGNFRRSAIETHGSAERDHADPGGEMGMMDFLTTPQTTYGMLHAERTQTVNTAAATARSRTPSLTVFDFVNMKNPRAMTKMSNKESIFPIFLVTILFFLWGFAYGLLDILNQQFQLVVGISQGQAIGLHAAYYGAYFVAPLAFGHYVFRKGGFKATFMTGLCIYGIGTLVFWPSAVLASFVAFLISNFIIGMGVATLETAGNPFITLCGPPEYAEVRLNISQGVQAIGTVVSPILAQKVFFKSVNDAPSLINVQWAYLGIALFVVALALIFFYLPIPEASDEELESLARRQSSSLTNSTDNPLTTLGIPTTYLTLALGILAQFSYVGAQEAVASFYQQYIALTNPSAPVSPFYYQAVGHTVFALGRFLTAALNLYIKPRRILLFLFLACILTSALTTHLTGAAGTAMLVLTLLFESGIFSLIFAISLRGMGRNTKWAAVLLTAATSGGAVIPAVMNPVKDSKGVQYAYVVTVAVFAFGTVFPAYLAVVPNAKRQVDPIRRLQRGPVLGREEEKKGADETQGKRGSRVFHDRVRRKKAAGSNEKAGGSQQSSEGPEMEHVERTGPAEAEVDGRMSGAAPAHANANPDESGEGQGGEGRSEGKGGEGERRGPEGEEEKEEEEPMGMRLAPWPT